VAHAARLAIDTSDGGTSVELERLANETPDARASTPTCAGCADRIALVAGGHRAGAGAAAVLLAASDTGSDRDGGRRVPGHVPARHARARLVLVIAPRLVSSWWAALPVAAAMVLLIVSSLFGAAALVLVVVQGSIVVQRLTGPMSVYRDDASGLAARLGDLRADVGGARGGGAGRRPSRSS
jgi:hypothetical protein